MFMKNFKEKVTFGGPHVGSIFRPEDPADLIKPFTPGLKAGYYEFFSDASNATPSITGGVGMIKGAIAQPICLRQHLKAPCSHTSEVVAAGTNLHLIVPFEVLLWRRSILLQSMSGNKRENT